ncbi:MAG TPA: hypothetical protein VFI02_02525 [Armatimonadota bacterium]|nr:hypothetical protein [Armatimonadota bacterium]
MAVNGGSRFTEFITVLIFALVIGAATGLAIRFIHGRQLTFALLGLGAVTILAWRFLGRRFGRR